MTTPTPYNINGVTGKRWTCKTNQEWREERSHSIGASAVGTIMGDNPFSTPLALAVKMREELQGEFNYTQNTAMRRGHYYEPGVAAFFADETGHGIITTSAAEYLLRRDDIPFMHASPDRTYWIDENGLKNGKRSESNKGILECKTTRRKIDPDRLPLSWIFQLQVQMGISGYHQGFIAWDVLTEREGFGLQYFDFDEELFNNLVEICRDFWNRCIIGGEQPEPLNTSDILALYPKSTAGKSVTVGNDIKQLISSLKDMKDIEKELKAEIDNLSDQLKMQFADAEAMVDIDSNVLATYRNGKSHCSINTDKLKADFPDVYSAVAQQRKSTRILLIK